MHACSLVSNFCDPMGFSRQEYWSGLPFPPPGDLPKPGIKPMSPALAGGFFTTELLGKPSIPKAMTQDLEVEEVVILGFRYSGVLWGFCFLFFVFLTCWVIFKC